MTFDWHFECGNSTKHNNWAMHSFAMLLLHANGTWSKKRLEEELTALAVNRNAVLTNGETNKEADGKIKNKSAGPNLIVTVRKVPKDELDTLTDIFFQDTEPSEEAEAWVAEVGFRSKPTPEQLKDTEKMLEGEGGKDAIMHAINQAKRGDYLKKESKGNLNILLTKLLSCDGETINPIESMYIIDLFMKISDSVHKMAAELVTNDMLLVAKSFGYSAASGNSFQVY